MLPTWSQNRQIYSGVFHFRDNATPAATTGSCISERLSTNTTRRACQARPAATPTRVPSQGIKAATLQLPVSDSRVLVSPTALECPNAVCPPLSTPIQSPATTQKSLIPIAMTRRKGEYSQSREARKGSEKFTPLLPPLHTRLILPAHPIRGLHTLLNLLALYVSLC
jgi:hypothetical protein